MMQTTITTANDDNYWYFYDANGNVGQVLDATDVQSLSLAARYDYDPYGNTLAAAGPYAGTGIFSLQQGANRFGFSTKWLDNEIALGGRYGQGGGAVGTTGLYYYGYRYYAPALGRWINRDPIEELGGLHLYAFLSNQSPFSVDYLGLFDWSRLTTPGTFEIGIPVSSNCQIVATLTIRNKDACCQEIDVTLGGSCSIKSKVIDLAAKYLGSYAVKALNILPDISAQVWGQATGQVCTGCWELCEISINGALNP